MEKTCKHCGHTKPLTIELWLPRKESKDGFRGTCRECWLAHYKPMKRVSYAKHKERLSAERREKRGTPEKIPLTREQILERKRARAWADYRQRTEWHKQQDRAYYWRNRDAILAKQRQYRAEHADYCRLRDFKWRILNPEKVKAKHRRYHLKHRERLLPLMRQRNRQRYQMTRSLDYGYTKGWEHTDVQYTIYRDRESQAERQAACVEFLSELAYCLNDEQAAFLMALEQADGNADEAAHALEVNVGILNEIRQVARRLDARPI